jgi:hypothetical protein
MLLLLLCRLCCGHFTGAAGRLVAGSVFSESEGPLCRA